MLKKSVFSGPAISLLKLLSRRGLHIEAIGCPHQPEVRSLIVVDCQVSFLIKPSIALKCNVTNWTNWSPCCKGETTRKKVVLTSLGGKPGLAPICKTKMEVFNCDQDQCAGELGLQWCKGGQFVISKWCCKKWFWWQILGKQLGHLVSEAQWVRVGFEVSSKHIAPSPILWHKICVVQLIN